MDIRVLVCCRINLLAEGMRRMLEPLPGIRPVGVACEQSELVAQLRSMPDIIVADPSMGTAVLESLPDHPARLLLLHDSPPADDLRDLIASGLGGMLPRDADVQTLGKAIGALAAGELWFDRKTVADTLCCRPPLQPRARLTRRESEVLHHICEGLSNKQIAQSLHISEQTVKSHCNRLYKKFKVTNRLKLALCVQRTAPRAVPTFPPS